MNQTTTNSNMTWYDVFEMEWRKVKMLLFVVLKLKHIKCWRRRAVQCALIDAMDEKIELGALHCNGVTESPA